MRKLKGEHSIPPSYFVTNINKFIIQTKYLSENLRVNLKK